MDTRSNDPDAFILRPRRDIEEMISKGAPTILGPNTPLQGAYADGQSRRRERRQRQHQEKNHSKH